jgi:cytochrome oxidase Cu insertion factor (SCO1/SenC/PrrC family)
MNKSPREVQTKARFTLLAIITVFALPLALAWLFTVGPFHWRPANTVNYGLLLQPPLRLESYGVMDAAGKALTVDTIARNWFLVVLHNNACTEPCQTLFQIAERIQIAVGRDMQRITLVSLGPDDEAPVPREKSWTFPADGNLVEKLRRSTGKPQLDTALLIVDYQGHIVLVYPSSEDGQGVLKDLERLLRASAR